MTVYKAIALSVADAIDHFPMLYDDKEEMKSLLKQAQDILFRSWDQLCKDNPNLKEVGLWPYLDSLKKANQ